MLYASQNQRIKEQKSVKDFIEVKCLNNSSFIRDCPPRELHKKTAKPWSNVRLLIERNGHTDGLF